VVEGNMSTIIDAIAATKEIEYNLPEFAQAESEAATKVPVMSGRFVPKAGFVPANLYDPEFFDDILARPFREGWPGAAPVIPGTGLFLPPGTGAAKNKGLFRRDVPVVDMEKCTACLECALACPDSAIPNQAHEIADVLTRAIKQAELKEEHKTFLLTFTSQWAEKARQAMLEEPKPFNEIVRETATVVPNIPKPHLEAILKELAAFPVARIRPIFDQMEKKQSGTGAVYSVVIDPWKCTGCLQCVEVCGPGALSAAVQTDELVTDMESTFEKLTQLPNTPARFTQGAANPGGDAKRILLDHNNYFALSGGHGACRGCGEVTATHLVMALSQSLGAEKREAHIAKLESLIYALTSKITQVEPERARRITKVIEQLESSLWFYESGPTGQGPASSVIVNSTGCSSVYGSTFPSNPFIQPWVNSLFQDAQASAVGVFEGLVSSYMAEVQATRIAELELAGNYDPGVHDPQLVTLSWREFTDEELSVLPLVLTISGDGAAFDIGFGALSRVLTSQTPVKMMVLDTGGYSNTGGQASTASLTGQNADLARHGKAHHGKEEKRKELGLLAALHPDVFVASVSTSMHSHFLTAAARMITYPHGSALLQVYSPCGFEQGFADDLSNARAELAVRSRIAPLFVHDPMAGTTINQRLSLDGNPEIDKPWATRNLKYTDAEGQVQVMSTPLTPAEFAYGEVRFAKHFARLADDAPSPTPIADFLTMPDKARAGRTPFIVATDAEDKLIKVAVSPVIVSLAQDRQRNWQLLRFLAGRDADMQAKDAQIALKELREQVAEIQAEREQGIDDIAQALVALATAKDPSTVVIPTFGSAPVAAAAPAAAPPPPAEEAGEPVSASGLGGKPAGAPIWLAESDLPKCTDCATCYQELPAIFEQTTIVVDGEAKDVSRMKPGALDSLEVTPELEAVMDRVRDTCDAEIIQ
ncbi:MAG: 4Fe-4S binding protein, partial [Propionibacteriaceae bacterium]|nr:4Fe-4S binding protein [Propionibacteriaceae bacterium]